MICQCCGRPLDETTLPNNLDLMEEIDLSPQQRLIFSLLAARMGKWVERDTLIREMYAHDVTGGPENERNVLSVQICKLRPKVGLVGLVLDSRAGLRRLSRAAPSHVALAQPLPRESEPPSYAVLRLLLCVDFDRFTEHDELLFESVLEEARSVVGA